MYDLDHKIPFELKQLCKQYPPDVYLVLGSGFGCLAEQFLSPKSWPFNSLPGINSASILGHKGCLTHARFHHLNLLISEGRIHFYEGNSKKEITNITKLACHLGCHTGIFTNASGGISPNLNPGDIMLIENHIDTISKPWNSNPEKIGFSTNQHSPYDPNLLKNLKSIGISQNINLSKGTYMMVSGPSYETNSEIRCFSSWKADAVGMSTAWEVEEGFQNGMKCAGISGITNKAAGLSAMGPSHLEVLENAKGLSKIMGRLIFNYLENI